MRIWLVSSPKRYHVLLFHLINELVNACDPRIQEFQNLTELEALHFLRGALISEGENSLELTLVVDGDQTSFLTELHQLIVRCPYDQQQFRVVIFSNLTSWGESYPQSAINDLGSYFIARKPNPGQGNSYRVENCFSQLAAHRKIRSNLILLGLLYGGDGQDFKPLLRQIWQGNLSKGLIKSIGDRRIPFIHYQRFLSLMSNILLQSEHSFGFIVPAFDWEDLPLKQIAMNLNRKINYDLIEKEEENSTNASNNFAIESMHEVPNLLVYDVTNLIKSAKFYSQKSDELSQIEQNFGNDWNAFIDLAGLKPLSLLIVGAPKTGKTTAAKSLSESLQIALIDMTESVVSLLKFDSSSVVLPPIVDLTKVVEFQQEIKSFIEAKLQEGKKPGKEKNPAEPFTIDYSLLNEAFCLGIPVELLRKALSYSLNFNKTAGRKGFILDIWEKAAFESIADVHTCRGLILKEPHDAEIVPLDIIIELQSTEKSVLDKQIELIGPANMKSKDAQASIKTLETQLTSYFSSVVQVADTDLKSHRKILDYESAFSGSCSVIRRDFSGIDYTSLTKEIGDTIRIRRGRAVGWLEQELDSKDVDKETLVFGEKITETVATDCENLANGSNRGELTWNGTSPGIAKIDEFLNITLLPVLAKGLIEAVRNKPYDPILFVANFLAEVSQKQQQEAYESAKKQFEDLLLSS